MVKSFTFIFQVIQFHLCPPPGRDSPPPNEASEEMDESMPVPEDLSSTAGLQQNNRADKSLGEFDQIIFKDHVDRVARLGGFPGSVDAGVMSMEIHRIKFTFLFDLVPPGVF